ncbi:max protein [Capsaspora owczarzaki ATCC 30864]|nr:max protein [Capsaspora owczarzaki ATCC 30864]|eukprot:XP_004364652.2 max protein [Capsaspora owczarzaki ATCC 30864]
MEDVQPDASGRHVKRAHHNALERKRRDHIKEKFNELRDTVPSIAGDKASRSLILNRATEFIVTMKQRNTAHEAEIDAIRKQNETLRKQILDLENGHS